MRWVNKTLYSSAPAPVPLSNYRTSWGSTSEKVCHCRLYQNQHGRDCRCPNSCSGSCDCRRRRKRRKEIPIFLLNTSCPLPTNTGISLFQHQLTGSDCRFWQGDSEELCRNIKNKIHKVRRYFTLVTNGQLICSFKLSKKWSGVCERGLVSAVTGSQNSEGGLI